MFRYMDVSRVLESGPAFLFLEFTRRSCLCPSVTFDYLLLNVQSIFFSEFCQNWPRRKTTRADAYLRRWRCFSGDTMASCSNLSMTYSLETATRNTTYFPILLPVETAKCTRDVTCVAITVTQPGYVGEHASLLTSLVLMTVVK